MNDGHADDDISRLYQKSRHEQPPMRLDSAILSEARKAVEKKPGWNFARWLVPLTSVALVMLTATLFIQTRKEQPQLLAPEPAEEMAAPRKEQAPDEGAAKQEREMKDIAPPSPKRKAMEDVDRMQPRANEAVREPLKKEGAMDASKAVTSDDITSGRLAAPAATLAPAPASEPVLQPEAWLEQILELKHQGRDAEASESLEGFRLAYPDYVIPGELMKD